MTNTNKEVTMNKELLTGKIKLGTINQKKQSDTAYLLEHEYYGNTPLVLVGPQGCGKSEYLVNYAIDAINSGESVFVIDYIKNCELSKKIADATPSDRLCIIDMSDPKTCPGFSFPELDTIPTNTPFELLYKAERYIEPVCNLISSVYSDCDLTPRMRRTMVAVCKIVFLQKGKTLQDFTECLTNHITRHAFIELIPAELEVELANEITTLKSLDLQHSNGLVYGTNSSKTDFILDRLAIFEEYAALKAMYSLPYTRGIDFTTMFQQGKVVLVQLPETTFPLKQIKNTLASFFACKFKLAYQQRCDMPLKPVRVHGIFEEIYQTPSVLPMLQEAVMSARPYNIKLVFSTHYLSYLSNGMTHFSDVLQGCGSDYMFFEGCDPKNLSSFEGEVFYASNDFAQLERHHALCRIRTDKGLNVFVVKVPTPYTA